MGTSRSFFLSPALFIYVPTAFSPNGDGLNDHFGVAGVTLGVLNYRLQIFNRWGENIYTSYQVDEPWNGKFNGIDVPQGNYVYMMQFTDYKGSQWYRRTGEVHLMR